MMIARSASYDYRTEIYETTGCRNGYREKYKIVAETFGELKRKKMGNGRQEERGKEAPHKTTQYRVYGLSTT